jgi:ribonuclease D
VHYCKSLESTETVAQHFLNSKVVGFDMEWKAQASAMDSIQNNLSLIQIANEERIALFQIALFKPARSLEDFVAPSLKRIIESADITKVGVSIKADSTRLRKYLGVEAKSIFELSHLYKLVKYGQTQPKLVNKRTVNLSEQVEEHLGLPLEKSDDVRCGDWARSLNYRQVQCEFCCLGVYR